MNHDLHRFEREMSKQLAEFQNPELKKRKRPVACVPASRGLEVTLVVRDRQRSLLDERFVYISDSISELQAKCEARQAARKKGWAHIAYVHSVKKV